VEILSPQAIVESFKTALADSLVDSRICEREVAVKKNLHRAIWIYVKREGFRRAVEHICTLQEYPHLAIISSADLGDTVELIYHFTLYYGYHLQELSLGVEVVDIPDGRRLFLPDDFPDGVYPWRTDETGPQDMLRVLPGREPKYGSR
jgi:membrane-bound hydrogenase subunit beta